MASEQDDIVTISAPALPVGDKFEVVDNKQQVAACSKLSYLVRF